MTVITAARLQQYINELNKIRSNHLDAIYRCEGGIELATALLSELTGGDESPSPIPIESESNDPKQA